ncbi:PREDICTED: CST complex subunit CTC1 isoform X2 [Gavialis gangeticus]|uniref:CST complex subunit CTC1 isoform X2 n=1 Tax=Gavialis gangeticus TaxID=94835 RepID=UPI00092E2CA6|nr:PREDICTED: CST complex subunit CTC1 isoform X2 [Gavialis gangeticus]
MQLLITRVPCRKRAKLNVAGELARLSSLLCINHKTFFFLFLKCFTSAACVPVLVQKPAQLAWHHVLKLGHGYVLTALSMSGLKMSGHKVFVTSFSSCLRPYHAEQVKEQPLDGGWQEGPIQPVCPQASVQLSSLLELRYEDKRPVLTKESKILSYVGTITRVLNAQAGLYELDNKVCLCLAYQQLLYFARGLRPGACVELRDIHLLQKPLGSFHSIVLGACLHSTVLLKDFSRLSTFHQPVASSGNLYLELLFRYNLSLPLYLWVVSLIEMLEQRFSPFFGRRQLLLFSKHQSPGVAEKFLVPLLDAVVPSKNQARNIYSEILGEIHECPLHQYQPLEPPCQAPALSLLCSMAEKKSLETFCPSQLLLPLDAQHMGTQELNCRLAWSYSTFSAESFQPRMVLLGVLRVSSKSSSLQLQDHSGVLPCVICRRDGSPFADTALIGSLLQVETYQLVVEMFLQSDFPSWEQLLNLEHVREKKTSLYVQFYFEDAQILSHPKPLTGERPASRGSLCLGKKDDGNPKVELDSPDAKVPKLEGTEAGTSSKEYCARDPGSTSRASCVSRLFLVTQKEGLMPRNYMPSGEGHEEKQELQPSFQATAVWMGKPRLWANPREIRSLPESEQTTDHMEGSETQQRVLLLFMGKSSRWFPVLHPNGLYQIVVPHCTDLGVFKQLCLPPVPERVLDQSCCPSCLSVPDTWHLQHETWISCLAYPQLVPESVLLSMGQRVSSIPDLFSPRFHNVYCTYVASSCIRIIALPVPGVLLPPSPKGAASSPPLVLLSSLLLQPCSLSHAQAFCHLSHVLALSLHWICSLCCSIFREGRCTRQSPPCPSYTGVSQASARILVEDGTGEALVQCRNQQVVAALGLNSAEWEAVQSCVQSRGSISIQLGGTSAGTACVEEPDDLLVWYLRSLCRSPVACRPILLTFSLDRKPSKIPQPVTLQLRRFLGTEVEFMSQVGPRPILTSLNIQEAEHKVLSYLNRKRTLSLRHGPLPISTEDT